MLPRQPSVSRDGASRPSGARAGLADELLRAAGVTHVHVLDGGVLAWDDAGYPTVGDR